MFCKNCGKELNDNAKFCPHCGVKVTGEDQTPVNETQTVQAPVYETVETGSAQTAYQEPILGGSGARRGKGLVFGVIAAALVVCVGAGVALAGMLGGSPQTEVEKAMKKSVSAYSQMVEDMGLTTLSKLQEKQAYSTDFSVTLKELPTELYYYFDASVLEGLGVRVGADYSLEKRAMSMSAAAYYGSADLVQAAVSLDDTVLSVYAPEFLGDSALGMDTMTLGADLSNLDPGNQDMYKDISFNLYDFLDKYTQTPEVDPGAVKALRKAIQVEKTGKESVEVNGTDLDCTGYRVLIPEDALRDYLDATEDAVSALEMEDAMMDLMESMGVPQSELAYMERELENAMSGKEIFDGLKQAVKTVGDIELQVYLNGGYVSAVEWEPVIDGERLEMSLYLGGGKTYEDQWSFVISGGGDELRVESEGDHTASSGRYTDLTTISYTDSYGSAFTMESELEYDPKAHDFMWSIQGDGFAMEAEGQLTSSKDAVSLALDNLEFQAYGETMLGLEMEYSIRPYEKRETGAAEVNMIGEMSASDLEDLGWEIQDNAQDWVYDLMDKIPALQELMWYL